MDGHGGSDAGRLPAGAGVRVALDARTMQTRPPNGIGRMLSHLLPLMEREVDLELLTDGRAAAVSTNLPQHRLKVPALSRSALWLQVAAPWWLRGFDGLFHCPFHGLPYTQPVPMVVTIHDLFFETNREWYGRAQLLAFRAQARWAARTARRILAPSAYVVEQITNTYRVARDRIVVAPIGVDPVFRPEGHDDVLEAALTRHAVGRPYVIALGGRRRRALPRAVTAWRQLRQEGFDTQLVVVGPEPGPPEAGVVSVGPVGDDEWAALLAGAAVFCYPTLAEGFGMPALESVASGTPVVCARVGALPEVLGDAAEWCESGDAATLAKALARVIADDERAKELCELGLRRAAIAPTWSDAAAAHVRAYGEALR